MSQRAQSFFLQVTDARGEASPPDQRLCVFHRAATAQPLGRVVYVHPLAEEMNKSRRMAGLQARALAAAGFSVLQIDLLGCGDSSGDFGDASWAAWVSDVLRACHWLREVDDAHAQAPVWLWGLRAGCLLAVQAAEQLAEPVNFCFWQPSSNGQLLLQQFLRLKLAGEMGSGGSKPLMEQMRARLSQGLSVEIAGYALAPALASGLEAARLAPSPDRAGRVEWFELSSREDGGLTPASVQAQATWTAACWALRSHVVRGPAFWQTVEIEEVPALIEATVAALRDEAAR